MLNFKFANTKIIEQSPTEKLKPVSVQEKNTQTGFTSTTERQAAFFYKVEEYDKAIEAYSILLTVNSNNVDYLSKIGESYYFMEKYNDALQYLLKAYSLDSEKQEIIKILYLSYDKLGNTSKANEFKNKLK